MRRLITIVAIALSGLGACDAVAGGTTTAGNREAAIADAGRLVQRGGGSLPGGTTPSAREPAGDGGLLADPPFSTATSALVDRHAFFVVPRSLVATRAYLAAHPPAPQSASGASQRGTYISQFLGFSLPPTRALGTRQLMVALVGLDGGHTAVRIDGQDAYVVVRSPREVVPATARILIVTRSQPGQTRPDINRTVSSASTVRRLAALLDALPLAQPGAVACPSGGPAAAITFTFRASRHGRTLATSRVRSDADSWGVCFNGVELSLGGRAQPLLDDDGSLVRRAGRVLGLTLTTKPAAPATSP